MPLERFIPKSPDPFIRNSQDFEVAKFGHLNTIIEYVNSYVVTDSLQLSGTGPLTSTARYITDSLGNASSLAISTVNIGIGITTPGAALEIYGGVDTLGISGPANQAKSIQIARYNNSSFQSHYIGDDGGAFFGSGLTISASGSGSQLYLQVSAAGRNVNIGSAGQTLLPKDLGARLGVRGSGTTSATTAFLVQNSAGTNILQVRDDGVVRLNNLANLDGSGVVIMPQYYRTVGDPIIFKSAGGIDMFYMGSTTSNFQTPVGIGVGFGTIPLGRLQINGSGSTSATTSLLVQNSAATQILKVQDDGQVFVNQGNQQITFAGAGGISRIQAPNEMTIGLGASFNAMKVYYDGRVGLQNDAVYISSGNVGIGTTAPAAKLTIDSGNLLFTTTGNSEIYGLRNGVNQDTRIIINNQSTGGLHLGAKFGNPTGSIYFECGSGAYTERMRLTPNGNLLIGTTSDTARLNIVGSGSTSATTSLLVQNSLGNRLLEQKDNGWLYIGNTATDTGVIYVPHSPTYADRVFMRIDGGFPLFSTISNALLEISCAQFYTQGDMTLRNANTGIRGGTASNINNSSIQLSTQVNAYNGTSQNDACSLVYIENRGATLQAAGSINWIKMDGNVYEAGGGGNKWCTGIYYNPSFTGGTLLANSHYCYHATSGQMMVNTTSPNASAQLQVDSTTRGFLPPRMTTAQRTAIVSPAAGLIVYDTTTNKSYTYDGTAWQAHY